MYEAYYGFQAKPFQLSPDPAFLFASHGHRRAMAYLLYGMHQGEGFIVVTGEIGAGKTTLVRALARKPESKKVVLASETEWDVHCHGRLLDVSAERESCLKLNSMKVERGVAIL